MRAEMRNDRISLSLSFSLSLKRCLGHFFAKLRHLTTTKCLSTQLCKSTMLSCISSPTGEWTAELREILWLISSQGNDPHVEKQKLRLCVKMSWHPTLHIYTQTTSKKNICLFQWPPIHRRHNQVFRNSTEILVLWGATWPEGFLQWRQWNLRVQSKQPAG